MIRQGARACLATVLPVTPDTSVVVHLDFDRAGRLRDFTCNRLSPQRETPADEQAALLVQGMAAKLRRIGSLAEALQRARLALDLLENLQALEEMHGADARRLLAAPQEAIAGGTP